MDEQEKLVYFEKFNNSLHRIGRIGLAIAIMLVAAAPILMGITLKTMPDWNGVIVGLAHIVPVYLPVCIAEFLIYSPMLGTGASYLAFITGNLNNLKIPCVIAARDVSETEIGTPEDEVISTLSVATSSLVTIVVIAFGVLMLTPLQPILSNPLLTPAFNHVVPALFGAIGCQYFSKHFKLGIIPLTAVTAVYLLVPKLIGKTTAMLIPTTLVSIGIAWVLYKKANAAAEKNSNNIV